MFVKLLSGRNAGQSVEMKYADAKPLLDDGRAVHAFPPDAPLAAPVPAVVDSKSRKNKKK
jgi:hypothetical protein